jgi:hypothetical protein
MDGRDAVLRRAGWTPERRVSTSLQAQVLTDNGFAFWSELGAFIAEYDGLELRFLRPPGEDPDIIKLDAGWAAKTADAAWVTHYAQIAGTGVAPVGAAYRDHLLIWLGVDGRFFASYDAMFGELGSGPSEMLDCLLGNTVRLRDTSDDLDEAHGTGPGLKRAPESSDAIPSLEPTCPTCRAQLRYIGHLDGRSTSGEPFNMVLWECPSCAGRFVATLDLRDADALRAAKPEPAPDWVPWPMS